LNRRPKRKQSEISSGKDYTVESSYGHVRDLRKVNSASTSKKTFAPTYVIPKKAVDRVAELKKLAKKADAVILATDEDREGEAIAWHLVEALDLKRQKKPLSRIVFHEITKSAIEAA
jgi:DNA topoisomerase-1